MSWCCLQLGSREHYAVPFALHRGGALGCLITDTWLSRPVSALVRPLSPALAARRHEALPNALVRRKSVGRIALDLRMRVQGKKGWDTITTRNDWFGRWAAREVERSGARTLFSYSYTAKWPFRVAKTRGLQCVLSLIDGGWVHEEIISERTQMYRNLAPEAAAAPREYWEGLREELELADRIVVNSSWSKVMWIKAGVSEEKMVDVPLVYEPSGSMEHGARGMEKRPSKRLQALFLGSVSLAKGVGQLFDAIRMLKNEPVDFTFAGPIGVKIPDEISQLPNVRFLGPVDKATAERLYRDSDVFLFPTLSDGFGLTQLEALGHGLPVIASTHCGQVVEDRVSGLVLSEITPEAIADAIMQLVRDRDLLARLKANARVPDKCHPRHLAPALLALERH